MFGPIIHNYTSRGCVGQLYIIVLVGEVWANYTSLISSLFIEEENKWNLKFEILYQYRNFEI